jgi:hypothetical protein
MTVAAPQRPTSTAGLDGVTTLVVERPGADLTARLAADDALGIARYDGDQTMDAESEPHVAKGMEVAAAASPEPGLFDGIVGALLGFLFG